MKIKNINIWRV